MWMWTHVHLSVFRETATSNNSEKNIYARFLCFCSCDVRIESNLKTIPCAVFNSWVIIWIPGAAGDRAHVPQERNAAHRNTTERKTQRDSRSRSRTTGKVREAVRCVTYLNNRERKMINDWEAKLNSPNTELNHQKSAKTHHLHKTSRATWHHISLRKRQ